MWTIICEEYLFNTVLTYLIKRIDRILYVRHVEGSKGPHYHILVLDEYSNKISDSLRTYCRAWTTKTGVKSVSKSTLTIQAYNKSITEWMEYVKHEHELTHVELHGHNVIDEHYEMWRNITKEKALAAKKQQLESKAKYAQEIRKENKLADIEQVASIIKQHNIQQITELSNVPKDDYYLLMTIYNHESIAQKLLDLKNRQRLNFETRCREKHSEWRWWQLALCSFMRNDLSDMDRSHLNALNTNYLVAGMELLDCIFRRNKIDKMKFTQHVEEVMECHDDKMNTLYLVGASDAGKTTLSKIIGTSFLRAAIGQAGNASQFIFQDIIDKTLIMIEEACFIPATVDDFKNVMGGEVNFSVNVKNKKNQIMKRRTPVITTSNRRPWDEWCSPHEATFLNRGYLYELNTPILKSQIHSIVNEYKDVCINGRIPLNIMHFLAYIATDDNDSHRDIAKQRIAGFDALAKYDWNSSIDYIDLEMSEFKRLTHTPYPDPNEDDSVLQSEDSDAANETDKDEPPIKRKKKTNARTARV